MCVWPSDDEEDSEDRQINGNRHKFLVLLLAVFLCL